MADVFSKAVSANATKNGSVVTTASATANYVSDQSRAVSGVSENTLENKYDNSFDDPTYYGGGGLSRGLLAYYRLEETSGVRYNRGTTGGGIHLTDNNTVGSTTGLVAIPGNPATAASFVKGNTEYLSLSPPSVLNAGGADFSISAWVNIGSAADEENQNVFGIWRGSGYYSYRLYYNGVSQKLFWYISTNGTNSVEVGSASVSSDTFYNVIFAHGEGTSSTFYLNGTSAGSSTVDVNNEPDTIFMIGGVFASYADSSYLPGAVDDFALWNRKITSTEVSQVYNSGIGKVLR